MLVILILLVIVISVEPQLLVVYKALAVYLGTSSVLSSLLGLGRIDASGAPTHSAENPPNPLNPRLRNKVIVWGLTLQTKEKRRTFEDLQAPANLLSSTHVSGHRSTGGTGSRVMPQVRQNLELYGCWCFWKAFQTPWASRVLSLGVWV